MKSKRLLQTGCGALACAVAASGLPYTTGHNVGHLRARHSIAAGDVTKTVMVTVSLGPSTTITLGAESTTDPCADESLSASTSLPTSNVPGAVVSTMTLTTEIAITIIPSTTTSLSSSFSLHSLTIPTISTTTLSATLSATSTTSSPGPPPASTPTDVNFNPITAPAIGGGNPILAQNAADAQALNRKFRELTFRDSCTNGDEACLGDGRAFCALNTWRSRLCTQPNTRCRAVPRMQTNGTVLGCYTEADLQARFSSTGQPGDAFGE